jgi:hypothetical protein
MGSKEIITAGAALLIAVCVLFTFIVLSPSSLVAKSIACGGITVAVLGGIKTLLEIIKLRAENQKLKEEHVQSETRLHVPSSDEIERYSKRNLPTSVIVGIVAVILGSVTWAAFVVQEMQESRSAFEQSSKALRIREHQLEEEQKRIEGLERENRALRQDLDRLRRPKKERPTVSPSTGSKPTIPDTHGQPVLVVKNGYKDRRLTIKVSGPTEESFELNPGKSSVVLVLQTGNYLITPKAEGFVLEPQSLSATHNGVYTITFEERKR